MKGFEASQADGAQTIVLQGFKGGKKIRNFPPLKMQVFDASQADGAQTIVL